LDEVQGLRNGFGGEQGRLGLTPDLTLLGKIIGGGFPIGAVGGRDDLLELTVAALTPGYVTHAGIFNGHLAAAVAGTMTLRHLDAAAISRLNDAAAALADRILAGAAAAVVPGRSLGREGRAGIGSAGSEALVTPALRRPRTILQAPSMNMAWAGVSTSWCTSTCEPPSRGWIRR